MFINGIPAETYGGIMLGTPRVSTAEYTSKYEYMRTRSTIRHLSHDVGLKELECHVAFLGNNIHDIQMKRSTFRAALIGLVDLSFKRDRFFYFAEYKGETELESEHENAAVSKFKFEVVQHLPLERITGQTVLCASTIPETDCRITATAASTASELTVGTVKFSNVTAGDVLVADGIDGKITKNNQAVTAEFIRLPYLTRGENTIAGTFSSMIVEYYPTFI